MRTSVIVFHDIFSGTEHRYAVYVSDLQVTYHRLMHQGEVIAHLVDNVDHDDFLLWIDTRNNRKFTDWWLEADPEQPLAS